MGSTWVSSTILLLQEAAPKSTKVTEETVEPKVEPKETKETETKVDDDAGVEDVNCYRLGLNFTQKNCTITCHVGKKMLSPTKKNDNQKRCTLLTLQLHHLLSMWPDQLDQR